GLSARERRLITVGVVVLVLVLLFGVIVPLERGVSRERTALAKKRADLLTMQGMAPELQGAPPVASAGGESLLVIVDRSARESGLAGALAGSEPGAGGSLAVRLEKAPFDNLVAWLARLSLQNGVIIDAATIEKSGAPGLVNAAIVLRTG
ncbi:MAG: type II secretion system protein M, partial [Gammaproteobacteria bacterium]|nr:type II secretion system protein M [Gammaproteobacteria bacterium]